jgi:hypothetical protein
LPVPFQAATWAKRSDIPSPTLSGPLSGLVQGVNGASFHAGTRVVQTMGPVAHSFTTFFGAAQMSFDEGKTWVDTYRGDLEADGTQAEWVIKTWSLDLPNGFTYHFQARAQLTHSFFVADGSILQGGIRIYASSGGSAFSPVQTLYSWPHIIANPALTGGNGVMSTAPSMAEPILIPGSGPSGEDAFWMAASFQLDVGGTLNRQTIRAADLWRSIDGLHWEKVRDLTGVFPFSATSPITGFSQFFLTPTGRLFVTGGLAAFTPPNADPITTSWTASNNFPAPGGNVIPMFGGTLMSHRNGSLISGGSAFVSCDDGANFVSVGAPTIPINRNSYSLKLGPSEAIIVAPGFLDPTTQTVCYYSADGGETWQGGEVWLASSIGELPVAMFLKGDGRPLVITTQRAFVSSDTARGVAITRAICPLANAGLASARPLLLCGAPLTPVCKD